MKSLIKFPLLALLCFNAVEIGSAEQAMAAPLPENAPALTGDSSNFVEVGSPAVGGGGDAGDAGGVGVNVSGAVEGGGANASANEIASSPTAAGTVTTSVTNVVTNLESGGTVSLPGGVTVTVPANVVGKVTALLKVNALKGVAFTKSDLMAEVNVAAGSGNSAAAELAEQIALEASDAMENVSLDVDDLTVTLETLSGLSTSPEKLPRAIDAVNDFVEGLSRPEMEALAQSPSYAMVQQILISANEALL